MENNLDRVEMPTQKPEQISPTQAPDWKSIWARRVALTKAEKNEREFENPDLILSELDSFSTVFEADNNVLKFWVAVVWEARKEKEESPTLPTEQPTMSESPTLPTEPTLMTTPEDPTTPPTMSTNPTEPTLGNDNNF